MISNKVLWGIVASGGTIGGLTGVGIGVKNLVAWENLKKEEAEILWEYVESGGQEKNCYIRWKNKEQKEKVTNESCREWTKEFEDKDRTIGERIWLKVEKESLQKSLEEEGLIEEKQEIQDTWETKEMVCKKEELYSFEKFLIKCEPKVMNQVEVNLES
ncbi:hypothetical protein [Mycoplasma suis]|uniref:Uncharacterized protein n=1 Tax=Mycoplasma suis (strain Illinois) TaxID=768700 RepID=F0QRI7_MYCSL|nr:hypothetical protein [Mycoplasma suis]ADX98107.1 hypothetical protein MSU_0575 [Mycoplasma suis str. Illinois]